MQQNPHVLLTYDKVHNPLRLPTFRPSGALNHWKKHSVSRLSYLFSHLHLLSSYSFSSTLLSSNLFLLSASSLLCFSSVHIVGSLTSKLPSIIWIYPHYSPIISPIISPSSPRMAELKKNISALSELELARLRQTAAQSIMKISWEVKLVTFLLSGFACWRSSMPLAWMAI